MAVLENEAPASQGRVLTIEGKVFGRGNKALFPNFQMPAPAEWQGEGVTLRALLEAVVRGEVARFRERQEQRTVLQALSAAQIAEGVAKGKIDSGGNPDAAVDVDADEAVRVAVQAFEDGVFFVFVDDAQKTGLGDTFGVRENTKITFLRLVALAGG